MKQVVIRQVKSLSMSCDKIGNLLLAKFSSQGASDTMIHIPASIVFWLLNHLPINQDPALAAPSPGPQITPADWESRTTPIANRVDAKEFREAIRLTFILNAKQDLTVVLNRSNVELMRQIMMHYRNDLIDLDA
ncbi:MAG: hypothetical protein M3Y65_09885 [Pseudomonadota bacterium]|nr:hypothetical protein [Pseudomonadota bacterium]